jgi:hypothetical protein
VVVKTSSVAVPLKIDTSMFASGAPVLASVTVPVMVPDWACAGSGTKRTVMAASRQRNAF